jgi:hypothetical protein
MCENCPSLYSHTFVVGGVTVSSSIMFSYPPPNPNSEILLAPRILNTGVNSLFGII